MIRTLSKSAQILTMGAQTDPKLGSFGFIKYITELNLNLNPIWPNWTHYSTHINSTQILGQKLGSTPPKNRFGCTSFKSTSFCLLQEKADGMHVALRMCPYFWSFPWSWSPSMNSLAGHTLGDGTLIQYTPNLKQDCSTSLTLLQGIWLARGVGLPAVKKAIIFGEHLIPCSTFFFIFSKL